MANFINLQTGQQLDTCGFFAYISSINWCNCANDEVWLGLNMTKTGQQWFMYFQNNTPTCADQAPTCMPPVINEAKQIGETMTVQSYGAIGIPTPVKSYQWQSSTDGVTFTDIIGQTGVNLALISAYLGKYIRVKGTANNGIGSPAVCYSRSRQVIPADASPVNTIAPIISGSTTQGSTLTCVPGTWTGFPSPQFGYQWTKNGQPINGATSNTYVLKLSDSLSVIRCVVTGSNGINPNATATSNAIMAGNYAPLNGLAPSISGNTTLGSLLTCSVGNWTGSNISFNFQWYSGLSPVGINSAQYQLQITDTLANITCVVTAVNPAGSASATSNTITADDYSPVNIIAPTIIVVGGGIPAVGSVLSCAVGTWQGSNLAYSFQWYRGATPVGTNSATYNVVTGDQGSSMTCEVTASNLGGSASATSNNINIPSGPGVSAPSNSTPPVISVAGGGPALAGKTLVANVGVWNGTSPISYDYEWFSDIVSVGTDPYYIMQSSDIGKNLTCKITATNAYGFDIATSNAIACTGSIFSAPVNVVAPTILVSGGGSPISGATLVASVGAWNGTSPITYSFEWFSGLTSVGTDSYYVLQPSDYGNTMTCVVKAVNAYGVASQVSNSILAVGIAPTNTVAPSLIGNNTPGSTLSVNLGSWNASPGITGYAYLWQFSTDNGSTWNSYSPSQISATKIVLTADIGRLIRCRITATNIVGNGIAFTDEELIDSAPINTVLPVISIFSGAGLVGSVLQTTNGTWSGSGTITYSYRWLRNGVAISGAISNQYTTVTADSGKNISCEVTATNSIAPSIAISNVLIPTSAPVATAGPIIYGSYSLGSTLLLSNGYYNAYPAVSITQKWQLSTNGGSTWNDIVGATGTSYVVQAGDVGNQIRVFETATNSEGVATGTSNVATISAIVVQRPDNTVAPAVTGTPSIGSILTATSGTWANTPTTFAYQWFRSGGAILGALASTYTLVSADVDQLITCRVTASNAGGSEVAVSNEVYAYDASLYAVITFATAQGYGLPTTAQQQWMSKFVSELKANSFWTIYDRFWLPLNNGSENFGRINWMNPTLGTLLSPLGTPAPTWSNTLGYTGNGTSAYLDTNFNPSTAGGNYTQNNAGRYAFVTARAAEGITYQIDGNSVVNDNGMVIAVTSAANRINQGVVSGVSSNTRTIGFHCITRTGASASTRSNDINTPQNIASAAMTNANQWLLRSNAAYANISIGWYAIGGGISDANVATLRKIVNKYLNNMF